MGFYRRRAFGDLLDELFDIFKEKPLVGGLLIVGVLALYWFVLPHLRDKMGLSEERYNALRILTAFVGIGILFVLRSVL